MYFNAHSHLELAVLRGVIPPGLPFVEWLERLVPLKRQLRPVEATAAAEAALQRMVATGTTVLADTLSLDLTAAMLHRPPPPLRTISFFEMIAFREDDAAQSVEDALRRQGPPTPGIAEVGLSPHAPYTITAALLRHAVAAAGRQGQWLSIHVAETPEETEMLVRGTGPLRDFLAAVLPAGWRPPGLRPVAWLDACGALGSRTLLAHANDLNADDMVLIRDRGCSVVVCPGTHVYFNRGEFPLARLLSAGIPVYLGTDSLASNEDVDMEREIQLACELSPGVAESQIRALASAERAAAFL